MKENGMFSFAGDKIHESSRILETRLKWDNEEGRCSTNESKGEIDMDQKIHERDRCYERGGLRERTCAGITLGDCSIVNPSFESLLLDEPILELA